MKNLANFISLEETDKDLIVSFAIDNNETGISSLILHRTLFFEEMLPEEERGVHVTYENDYYEQEDLNMLESGVFQESCRLKLKFMPPFFPQDPVLVFLD